MRRMILTLKDALHPSKCQVQTNDATSIVRGDVPIAPGFLVHVLEKDESLTLLGTTLSLTDVVGTEIPSRLAASWRLSYGMNKLLLNSSVSVYERMQLFDATVTSCALWCAESWTLRSSEIQQLRSAQRAMLRRIARVRRSSNEDYLDWIRRATAKARQLARASGIRD